MTVKKKAVQTLQDRALMLQAITCVAQDAVIVLDPKGKILLWNPAAQRIFGYSNEEAIGMDMHRSLAPQRYQEPSEKGFSIFAETGEGMTLLAKPLNWRRYIKTDTNSRSNYPLRPPDSMTNGMLSAQYAISQNENDWKSS